jgi:hypothetical protein
MSEQFKVGDVCVGQNFVFSTDRNGMECTVIGGLQMRPGINHITGKAAWEMLYDVRWADGAESFQEPYTLRRKRPPTTGEQMIRSMFDAPPVERRQPITAWQAQFDTAQALMTMGVRVKPGKWPVEVEV